MKAFIALCFVFLASFPSYAQKSMGFRDVDMYMKVASGIWIVEVVSETNPGDPYGPIYTVKVLQTLKGEAREQTMPVQVIMQKLIPGDQYLFFGFGVTHAAQGDILMDNGGNVSPIPIPPSFAPTQLQGKSLKEQIELILSERSAEIDNQIKQLTEEKKEIESGLETQRQLDKPPGH
jgi:hypothetical protein